MFSSVADRRYCPPAERRAHVKVDALSHVALSDDEQEIATITHESRGNVRQYRLVATGQSVRIELISKPSR